MATRSTSTKSKKLSTKREDKRLAEERAERRKFTIRIIALFLASGMAVITTGAAIGVEIWKSVLMGGAAGIAQLVERLARSAVKDGDITRKDLEQALDALSE